jgi:threonyl-tRNA synthetase
MISAMSGTQNLEHIRHSLAHLLAASVRELYPGAKNAIGPSVDDGFYQDFELPHPISDKDLGKIEQKMREKVKDWKLFEGKEVTADEAKKEFAWNEYKMELIDEFSKEGKKLTFYTVGGFIDLCKGGHVESPAKEIPKDAWKLARIAGAYWRGDANNKMLTRIYGLAFESKRALDAYEKQREEAIKRDHKKLGKELDLFTFSDLVGGGLPLWTPKGTLLRNILDGFVWELRKKAGYEQVEIPHITKKDLYEKSGHWSKFKDELFRINTREKHEFAMKPMNCPHHTQIYARKSWSYRELPQRYATTTMVYRDEQTGELSGLSRVRSITQDDAHVFCRPDQVKEEMGKIWNIIETFYGAVGFKLTPRLSLHDPAKMEKYLGTKETWEKAEHGLRELVWERRVTALEAPGEAAFYGPKIDFMGKDSIGREWQLATIQLDMNMPERFNLEYTDERGTKKRVVMIHAAIMGAIERYLSIIIEHFAGAFPLWLSPVQIKVLPVSEKFVLYAKELHEALIDADIRSELDESNETLGKKVRAVKAEKVPYWIVVGEKEETSKTFAIEKRNGEKNGGVSVSELITSLQKEIEGKI